MSRRVIIALIVFLTWLAITTFGVRIVYGSGMKDAAELLISGIGLHFLAALAFLIAAIVIFKWTDIRFGVPQDWVKSLWLPVLLIAALTVPIATGGVSLWMIVPMVAFNSLLVGMSEEIAVRGVIFHAFLSRYSTRTAIIGATLIFGVMHSLNVFTTGNLPGALIQSAAAACSGLGILAIYITTRSIWPAILFHASWDFLVFLISMVRVEQQAQGIASSNLLTQVMPLSFVLVLGIYGFVKLRPYLLDGKELDWPVRSNNVATT